MKTFENICVRVFPVKLRDSRSGEELTDEIVLTKAMLTAAQIVGQSSKELIHRICNREGYSVLEIGKPCKTTVTVDLEKAVAGILDSIGQESEALPKQDDNALKRESQA